MISFSETLSQRTLDIAEKTRANLFAWNGQFSPQLVEALIQNYCPKHGVILDPFVGSGTVLYEASRLGHKAFGAEINPSAWIFARVYELCAEKGRKRALEQIRKKMLSFLNEEIFSMEEEWEESKLNNLLKSIYDGAAPEHRVILDAFVISLDLGKHAVTRERVFRIFGAIEAKILGLPVAQLPVNALLSDARALPLPQGSIDFVITSPPYINVFNYHQNYRPSAEKLGWDLLKIARSEIGSNRANRGNRFLTVVQYCLDMGRVFQELHRLTHKKSRILFVVGRESNVLGVAFKNSALLATIAEQSNGLKLVQIQERQFKNRFGATIVEDILHFEPTDAA